MFNRAINHLIIICFSLIALFVLFSALTAYTATNSVPGLKLSQENDTVTPNKLKPGSCNSIDLSSLVTGTGQINGTAVNELILGSDSSDFIRGRKGNDCILGGDGNDRIFGNRGYDVCIGGGGNDIFIGCEVEIQ